MANSEKSMKTINDESVKVDRISSLPDTLLCHILSLLPTKDAVSTSFLSTKWKHIFPLTPNLKLDFDDSPNGMTKDHHHHHCHRRHFKSFVDSVLLVNLRDATHVHTMRLYCKHDYGMSRIEAWIGTAVRLNVESLDLKLMIHDPKWFCNEISNCTRLTTLKLTNSPIYVPDSFHLPCLNRLDLHRMGLFREATMANLFKGCPMLKELILVDCKLYMQILDISIPSLKVLMVQDCVFLVSDKVFEEINDYEIVLDTPELEQLDYADYNVAARYTVREMLLLQMARLDIQPDAHQQQEEDSICFYVNVSEIVITCSMVNSLYLSARTLQAVYCSRRCLAILPNLEHLDLQLNVVCPRIWALVIHILDCAPNLTSLGIETGLKKYKECENCQVTLGGWVPQCVTLHLRNISISAFTGIKQEVVLLLYFLKYAKYLEKMAVVFDSDLTLEEQLLIKEKLQKLPHSSNTFEMVVETSWI